MILYTSRISLCDLYTSASGARADPVGETPREKNLVLGGERNDNNNNCTRAVTLEGGADRIRMRSGQLVLLYVQERGEAGSDRQTLDDDFRETTAESENLAFIIKTRCDGRVTRYSVY